MVAVPCAAVLVAVWAGSAGAAIPTVTMTASPSSVAVGDAVTLTATVSFPSGGPGPTSYVKFTRIDSAGNVTVQDDSGHSQFSLTQVNATDWAVSVTLHSFPAGVFTVSAAYLAGGLAPPATSPAVSLTVGGAAVHNTTLILTSNPAAINVGDTPTFTATVTQNDGGTGTPTGVVTFDDNGVLLGTAALINGVATLTHGGFAAGTHVLNASYVGDIVDKPASGTYNLVVAAGVSPKVNTTTTVVPSPNSIVAGSAVTLNAHVVQTGTPTAPPDGNVIFYNSVGATDVYIGQAMIDANGDASITVSGWIAGSYDLKASYIGDISDLYNGSSGITQLTVFAPPAGSTLVYTGDTNAVYGSTAILSASLVATSGGAPVAGKTVTLTLGSQHCTAVTDSTGAASCPVNVTDPSGAYTATASFAGDSSFARSTANGAFTVSPRPTTVHIAATGPVQSGSNLMLSATMLDGASPIAAKTLTLSFGAQTCTATTDASGVASCTVPVSAAPGSYPTAASFAGDGYYSASNDTGSATVTAQVTTLQLAARTPTRYGDTATLAATLLAGSIPVAGETITLTLGSQTCTAVTNASGVATCSFTVTQPAGSYTTTGDFAGDALYTSSSASGIATVTIRPSNVHLSAVGTVVTGSNVALSATLLDGSSPLAGRTVALKLGALTCTAVTNASGVATCVVTASLAVGSYATSASFPGDSYYSASSDAGTALVATRPTALSVSAPASVQNGSSVTLTGTLLDGSSAIAGKTVTLTLGAQTCSATTNASGVASCALVVTQPAGTYTTTASFAGDTTYSPSAATGSISVTAAPGPRTTTVQIAVSGPLTIGNTATLTGTLLDGTTPIAGKTLTLALGSNACTTGATNASGVATCTVTVTAPAGTYATSASFAGDSTYKASAGYGTVVVALRPSTLQLSVAGTVVSGNTITVTGTLLDGLAPIAGRTLTLAFAGQTCTATTGATGVLSCLFTASQGSGVYPAVASFGGDAAYAASTDSAPVTVTLRATTATIAVPSPVAAGSSVTLSGTLFAGTSPVSGKSLELWLGTQNCVATTNGSGVATCTIALSQAAGSYATSAVFAGDAFYGASTGTGSATVTTSPRATIAVDGLSGNLLATGTIALTGKLLVGATPLVGKTLTLSLGSATCTAITSSSGVATCTVAAPATLGPTATRAAFAGDSSYLASSDTKSVLLYGTAPGGGSFVVGDGSASGSVTFWGAQWSKQNIVSGGSAPSAFKGFAIAPGTPQCGVNWSTDPGNSSPPPGSIPAYMAVIVTSSAGKSGSAISGTTTSVVIVKTDAGYAGNPGHAGTGTVVATLCSVGIATPPANDTSSVAGNGQRDQGEQGDAHTDQAGDRESDSSDNQGPTTHDSNNHSGGSDVSWQSGCSNGGHSNDHSRSNDCSDRSSRRD